MKILNLEDNVFKHRDIIKALARGSFGKNEIDWVRNLEDGIAKIKEHIELGETYDLIITDMWYPEFPGGSDADSGEKLIAISKENGWSAPIILCSSVNYHFPGILGAVHYSENEDWEEQLVELIRRIV